MIALAFEVLMVIGLAGLFVLVIGLVELAIGLARRRMRPRRRPR